MSGKGLEGVAVAETSRSKVDGAIGRLIYSGYEITDLGENASFEEVAYLLWNSRFPDAEELAAFSADMVGMRAIPAEVMRTLETLPKSAHPVAVLRTLISTMGLIDDDADNLDLDALRQKAMRITSVMPTLVATWEHFRNDKPIIAPREDLGHASNFLYMLTGEEQPEAAVQAMDKYLILLADHGFNASTFSARVTTGTLSDMYSAVTTAIGTLKGPSHGGAAQKAMEQFLEANEVGVEEWFKQARATGRRIMGIGHRVYKVEDPRAKIFGPLAKELAANHEQGYWYDVAYGIQALARQDDYFIDRNLFPNVDYYSAAVLYMIGIPTDQFTSIFAMSRVVGWTAHILEQVENNRLIRPRAEYVGPDGLKIER